MIPSGYIKQTLYRAGVAVLALVAIAWTATSARRLYGIAARADTQPESVVSGWRSYASVGQWIGSRDAKVIAVEFVDYKCTACGDAYERLRALQKAYPKDLAIVVRQNPFGSNADAQVAAEAALCAAGQARFIAFNELLLTHEDSVGRKPWLQFARGAGITDLASFAACLADTNIVALLQADRRAATALHYSLSPLLLIDGETYNGVPWDLERIVKTHLRQAKN